ncbi:hypothetical protein LEP1GSC178_2466 [Leptospira licerasiae str. MMD4847]|uniref:Uncharacterized protein n=1 Tax=Leptospira licerasiae str. MMD4847 TaxID=1049971 RepID=A0ABN0HC22_9LEPT|nr:hypothetical protein LEP1GSC178_2466 [Leptospira licerasiae str. MMD4847]
MERYSKLNGTHFLSVWNLFFTFFSSLLDYKAIYHVLYS